MSLVGIPLSNELQDKYIFYKIVPHTVIDNTVYIYVKRDWINCDMQYIPYGYVDYENSEICLIDEQDLVINYGCKVNNDEILEFYIKLRSFLKDNPDENIELTDAVDDERINYLLEEYNFESGDYISEDILDINEYNKEIPDNKTEDSTNKDTEKTEEISRKMSARIIHAVHNGDFSTIVLLSAIFAGIGLFYYTDNVLLGLGGAFFSVLIIIEFLFSMAFKPYYSKTITIVHTGNYYMHQRSFFWGIKTCSKKQFMEDILKGIEKIVLERRCNLYLVTHHYVIQKINERFGDKVIIIYDENAYIEKDMEHLKKPLRKSRKCKTCSDRDNCKMFEKQTRKFYGIMVKPNIKELGKKHFGDGHKGLKIIKRYLIGV